MLCKNWKIELPKDHFILFNSNRNFQDLELSIFFLESDDSNKAYVQVHVYPTPNRHAVFFLYFQTIRTKLRPLRKGMRSNIFDNMLAMMEKYANNLETLVDERTHLLIEEKQKTEDLLHLMLPKPVAEQLKQVYSLFV